MHVSALTAFKTLSWRKCPTLSADCESNIPSAVEVGDWEVFRIDLLDFNQKSLQFSHFARLDIECHPGCRKSWNRTAEVTEKHFMSLLWRLLSGFYLKLKCSLVVLTRKDQKKSSTFHKHPTQLKLDFVPRVLPNAFFQPKLSVHPVPLTAASEPGHGSSLHYLGRRGVLLPLLYDCTGRFMRLSACICYINKHSSTLSYISQHTLIESYYWRLLSWASLLLVIWMFV